MSTPRRRSVALALAFLVAVTVPVGAQEAAEAEDTRPGIAVMPLLNGGSHGPDAEEEDFEALEIGLQQILLTELSQNPEFRTVERQRLNEITREFGLADQGLVDPSTAAQVGNLVGARYMVFGGFTDVFGEMALNIQVVDVETGEYVAARSAQGQREQTLTLLIDLADQIAEAVDLPPLPDEVRDAREEQVEPVTPAGLQKYSRALKLIDAGLVEEGRQALVEVQSDFPEWEEPRLALERTPAASSDR